MTLDSTYLRARLARVIQEHFRLHRLDRLSLSIGLVEIIILHELARECGKHDRLQYFLAFCPDQANALGIMQLKDRVPGSIHSSSQCFLDDRQNRFRRSSVAVSWLSTPLELLCYPLTLSYARRHRYCGICT